MPCGLALLGPQAPCSSAFLLLHPPRTSPPCLLPSPVSGIFTVFWEHPLHFNRRPFVLAFGPVPSRATSFGLLAPAFFFFFFAAPISKSLSSFLKYSYSARTDLIICSFIHSFIPSLLLPSGSHVGALELMETIQPQATGEPGLALCVLL